MPLVQKSFTLTAGSTSDNLLADTNYNFVDDAVRLRFAFAVDTAGSGTADNLAQVSVNNSEYTKDGSIPALVTGQPFGVLNGAYIMNDLQTVGSQRNRLLATITNNTSGTRTYRFGCFIGG